MTKVVQGSTRLVEGIAEPTIDNQGITPPSQLLIGSPTPRIHSRLNDLPSRGNEVIDFSTSIGLELMPWQRWTLEHGLKYKPDSRWAAPVAVVVAARQNGKSTIMLAQIVTRLFLWNEPLQLGTEMIH